MFLVKVWYYLLLYGTVLLPLEVFHCNFHKHLLQCKLNSTNQVSLSLPLCRSELITWIFSVHCAFHCKLKKINMRKSNKVPTGKVLPWSSQEVRDQISWTPGKQKVVFFMIYERHDWLNHKFFKCTGEGSIISCFFSRNDK